MTAAHLTCCPEWLKQLYVLQRLQKALLKLAARVLAVWLGAGLLGEDAAKACMRDSTAAAAQHHHSLGMWAHDPHVVMSNDNDKGNAVNQDMPPKHVTDDTAFSVQR